MGADGFAVDLGALGWARDRVGRLADDLSTPRRDVTEELPRHTVFGHDRLAEAVREFAPRERSGLALLAGEAESIRHGLTETIRTYQKADEAAAQRFRQLTS